MSAIPRHADATEMLAALEARQPGRMVPDIERILLLAELLGRPDQAYPSIQVSGTNGKTSTSRMIAALLGALGLTAGTYTSPHLQDVRERFRIAADPLSEEALVARLSELAPYLAEVDARSSEPVTYFETLTAAAFAAFADHPVDVGVFEVGMGGTWDATNLVRGEVAVLQTVAVDHPVLGSTPEEIAREKVGIIKEGAHVVSAEQRPGVLAQIEAAVTAHGERLVVEGRDFGIDDRRVAVGGQDLDLSGVTGAHEEVYVPLHGPHQAHNAAVALATVEAFLGFEGGIDTEVVREAFAAVRVPGRCEVVPRGDQRASVVLDGAHNPAGMEALALTLRSAFAFRHRVAVLGLLADKDIAGVVAALSPVVEHVVVTEVDSPRAADVDEVAEALGAAKRSYEVEEDLAEAIGLAEGLTGPGDGICVTGSLVLVGAARTLLGLEVD
jgi:dihydrofolate synthase/folylpolyglutamate synthase